MGKRGTHARAMYLTNKTYQCSRSFANILGEQHKTTVYRTESAISTALLSTAQLITIFFSVQTSLIYFLTQKCFV